MSKKKPQEIYSPRPNPIFILIDPQMGENIGAAARAMFNCGLSELRLVRPRDGWPNEAAQAMSAGALDKMLDVDVFESTQEAISDCHYVMATTARSRDMVKPVYTARQAALQTQDRLTHKDKVAILFGAERTGLTNEDVSLAHASINIPLNPGFSSLNLGQAVLVIAYELFTHIDSTPESYTPTGHSKMATHIELSALYDRLESELDKNNFFRNPDQRPSMVRNLRNLLGRAEMTDQEVRTFHGLITALTGKKTPRK